MTCLILGGTKDARDFADRLIAETLPVIYSIKGLVRTPDLPCKVVIGGFTQFGGLSKFIMDNQISSILDATHPYADKMTQAAVNASIKNKIPCWVFDRPAWRPDQGDLWVDIDGWQDVADYILKEKSIKRVFLSAGQIPENFVKKLSGELKKNSFVLRTAVKPKTALPENVQWIKAIGPFGYTDELKLFNQHPYDLMVSKNSGGINTVSKLIVAREQQKTVLMFRRPSLPAKAQVITDKEQCIDIVRAFYGQA